MVDEIANIMGIDLSEFGLDATEMRVAVAKQDSRLLGHKLKESLLKEYGDHEKIAEMLKTIDKEEYMKEFQKKLEDNKISYMDTSDN